jgi:hypothetical protein
MNLTVHHSHPSPFGRGVSFPALFVVLLAVAFRLNRLSQLDALVKGMRTQGAARLHPSNRLLQYVANFLLVSN